MSALLTIVLIALAAAVLLGLGAIWLLGYLQARLEVGSGTDGSIDE